MKSRTNTKAADGEKPTTPRKAHGEGVIAACLAPREQKDDDRKTRNFGFTESPRKSWRFHQGNSGGGAVILAEAMNKSPDEIRTEFLLLLAHGMTHEEAYSCFDKKEFWIGIRQEDRPEDEENSLLTLASKAGFEERNRRNWEEEAVPLMMAGWTIEIPDSHRHNSKYFWRQQQVMSLYWRRPSRRQGKPGRKYNSTTQAFNAMMREQRSNS